MSGGRPGGSGTEPRNGLQPWFGSALSVLGSAVTVAAVGFFCALIYPILGELRAERRRGESGTEERMLGFWIILVLAALVGCFCCVFSWTLTYLDSHQPGMKFPPLLSLGSFSFRDEPGFSMSYGAAVLNGIMATLTVIWSLS
ncbi:ADP-ribosylation factor-like protein 6-interacting protein 6 [Kryptolebias marmoratus]|uniref:ADP ribosylation factor like GTPase 6 interacting protein 6 n=1 Tax=Kryptolebias marmoratus TaxID=37003 RepID=A0A3Q3AID6_KRYMA|nr:ADP-ribosylation factor-like protein 6-interacting protein 6 [Kryptolebias marmoratus]